MKYMIVLMNNTLRFCIALIYDPFYFLVDHTGNILTVTPGSMGKISSDENFIAVIVVIDQSDFSDIPNFVTMDFAIPVACLMS